MRLVNTTNGKVLADCIIFAKDFLARIKGFLGRKELKWGEALWIEPCISIHTIGMRFPIDVIFLDRKNSVIALRKALPPYRVTPLFFKAIIAVELPSGIIDFTSTRIGDKVKIIPDDEGY